MLKKYTSSYEVVLCWQQIVLFMEKLRNVRKSVTKKKVICLITFMYSVMMKMGRFLEQTP